MRILVVFEITLDVVKSDVFFWKGFLLVRQGCLRGLLITSQDEPEPEYFGGEIMPGEFGDAEFEVDGIPSPITPFRDGRHCTDFLVGIYRRSRLITGDIMR